MSRSGPLVYLDISIGTQPAGRLVFKLFSDVTPKAAENFRGLATGEYGVSKASGKPLCYRGCRFFRSVSGVLLQSGDFITNDGTSGESIWGGPFNDESFQRRHAHAGCLSMANNGRHTNTSQFFITLKKAPQFDGKHQVIGQLVDGIQVLRAMQLVPVHSNSQVPRVDIVITACGQLASAATLRNASMSAVRTQLDTLMKKHERELKKQAEDSRKLKGSDEESVSSSTDSETEAPSRRDKRRRQERKRQRFLESSTYAAQQAMEKVLAGVPLLQQLQPEAVLAEERAAALYEGDSSNSEEEEETKQRQKTEATEAAAVDPLGKLLLQLDEEAGSQTDEDTTAAAAADGESGGTSAARALILARKQRLLSLRLQLNQGRAMNTKEVIEEKRQWETPAAAAAAAAAEARQAYKRLQQAPMYRLYKEETEAATAAEGAKSATTAESSGSAVTGATSAATSAAVAAAASSDDEETGAPGRRKGKGGRRNVLDEPLAFSEDAQRMQKKKGKSNFGWNVFNEDALYRAHKKRLSEVPLRADEYRQQQESLGDAFWDPNLVLSHPNHKPSAAALERLAASVAAAKSRRGMFSRRRMFNEDADVSYINERNRIFNNKLERSFDTREIKQNFERGTAL
ncbi:peptidyl-prolyl cis-trans isomerase, cyclophylin protein, putative [Eimeria necatrix]|uniref:peptidylprolyl isomerase n=1 Tax=Eimeria necatrix TaxID=51315 RepID=U6MU75_9EIME|nr:peptidyl-prolyl cis-trans isomerase, cyclophylin protein, putative [Eimeria necatrix]CDJ66628.1 peptidyl-prolyl cis-trans isomerase, cyclophylin protein, putative [Eimeria necatrix]